MNIKKHIPNAITCCNLLCGCLAIVNIFEGHLIWASYLVVLAAVFDFFDGFTARLLKVSSPIGKDLDSLADMVTFGLVPGIMMFFLFNYMSFSRPVGILYTADYTSYIAFVIPLFSAIRLAKFNNDPRQTSSFIGLPTPANAIFFCSIPFILKHMIEHQSSESVNENSSWPYYHVDLFQTSAPYLLFNQYKLVWIAITILFSFLLVAEIPLLAIKFKHFKWKDNEIRYLFLILSLLLLIILQLIAIPLIIILYILISVVSNTLFKAKITS